MTLSSDSHYGKKYGKCADFLNDPFPTTGKYQINNFIHKYGTGKKEGEGDHQIYTYFLFQ